MFQSSAIIALRISVLLKLSGKTRGRISNKTLLLITGRSQLKIGLINQIRDALDDYNLTLVQINSGGFAVISNSALDGAPPLTLKSLLPDYKKLNEQELLKILDPSDVEDNEDVE